MVVYCIQNLSDLKDFISKTNDSTFTLKNDCLEGSSIGQHVRHVLEFYICLLEGVSSGIICYDKRKRDLRLETDREFAIYIVKKITDNLPLLPIEKSMLLACDFGLSIPYEVQTLKTSVERELAYCLEHSIHHMALIKVALYSLGLKAQVADTFGIAPSTIKNNSEVSTQ